MIKFQHDTRASLVDIREAIRRRAVTAEPRASVWRLPRLANDHEHPETITYGFLQYDNDGRWQSTISVTTGLQEKRYYDEFAPSFAEQYYVGSTWKTRLAVVVQTSENASRRELAVAERTARRLLRSIIWDARRIKHELKRTAVPVGAVPVWSDDPAVRQQRIGARHRGAVAAVLE